MVGFGVVVKRNYRHQGHVIVRALMCAPPTWEAEGPISVPVHPCLRFGFAL